MGTLDNVEWEACLLEPVHDRRTEWQLLKTFGFMPASAKYFLDCPWIIRAMIALDLTRVPLVYVRPKLAELMALVVSQDNSCRYCYAATRSILKIFGFPEAHIRRLEENLLTADLKPQYRVALEFARRVSRAAPLASRRDAAPLLAAGYNEAAVREITLLAALNVFYNRMSTLPALPPGELEGMAETWSVRLLRPLVRRLLVPRWGAQPEELPAERRTGPFAPFVLALNGLPSAGRLRGVIDDAWSSPALSRRAKAWVFAVIARGLGCPLSRAGGDEAAGRRRFAAAGD